MRKHFFTNKSTALALLAVLSLSLGVAGCGNSDTEGTNSTENNTTQEETNTTENTEAIATPELPDNAAGYQIAPPVAGDTIVTISFKDFGDVKIKMFPKEAPKAVENFTTHAKEGYYDGVLMHRIIDDFMIQGGDPLGDGTGGESIWGEPFENEIVEYLLPIRGSLCMANAGPGTNGSQFFITQCETADTSTVEGLTDLQTEIYEKNGGCPWLISGYTVFGQVYEGMDVVDSIAAVETDPSIDEPREKVVIEHIEVSEYEE